MALAISLLIFLSAVVALGGKTGSEGFSQAMQDVNSKIQNSVSQVKGGAAPGFDSYTCAVDPTTSRAVLTYAPGATTFSEDCIFLGKAFQVVPSRSQIYSRVILGNRTIWQSGTNTGVPVTDFTQANPEPALTAAGGELLMETYQLLNGATVKSSTIPSDNQERDLAGVYNNLSNNGTSNGSNSLLLMSYPFVISAISVAPCIEQTGVCSSGVVATNQWSLCIKSGSDNTTALLVVNSVPSGITTQIKYVNC
jgi:hypothetical protein